MFSCIECIVWKGGYCHIFEVVAVLVLNAHTDESLSFNAYKFKLDNFLTMYFVHVIMYYMSVILQEIHLDICIAIWLLCPHDQSVHICSIQIISK